MFWKIKQKKNETIINCFTHVFRDLMWIANRVDSHEFEDFKEKLNHASDLVSLYGSLKEIELLNSLSAKLCNYRNINSLNSILYFNPNENKKEIMRILCSLRNEFRKRFGLKPINERILLFPVDKKQELRKED